MAFLTGMQLPAGSLTVVKPRSRVSLAFRAAAMLCEPKSEFSILLMGQKLNMVCQWASIRPGISTLPLASITVAPAGAGMDVAIFVILSPSTSTLILSANVSLLPSNTLALLMSTGGSFL